MKKLKQALTLLLFLSGFSVFAQVSVDHKIVLTGTGSQGKLTGIQQVSANQDAVSANYVQRDSLKFAIATGSNNTYAVSLSPAITGSYTVGMVVLFQANFGNTGAATLNVNSLGAINLVKDYNTSLASGDIQQGQMVAAMYDGTNFQVISALSGGGWSLSGNALTGTLPASPNEFIGSSNAADWVVKTNGSERMRVQSTGNVGVGTTPNVLLDVNGALATRTTTAASFTNSGSITVGNNSHIIINSGSVTNAPDSFSITNGQLGQYLTLEMGASLYAQLPNSTLNSQQVQLAEPYAAFTPYSTLTLKWDGNYWVEIARSAGTLSNLPVALSYPATINGRQVFTCTGGPQTFNVPAGISKIFVKMWGAGGSTGQGQYFATGGAGAYLSGYLNVTAGKTLTIIVGAAGISASSGSVGGYGGGGSNTLSGGAGGGRTAVQITAGTDAATAGGGGGGGWGAQYSNSYYYGDGGGGGGATTGGTFGTTPDGLGGTTTHGGAAGTGGYGNGTAGSSYQGGNGVNYLYYSYVNGATTYNYYVGSGGGGGGYNGGGGGGAGTQSGCSGNCPVFFGGGGGGASYVGSLTSSTNVAGGNGQSNYNNNSITATTGPNSSDVDYLPGVATGGYYNSNTGTLTSSGNGEAVIYW